MCGIWVSINAPDADKGLQAAAHRGPDGEGWARFETPAGQLEMGHKRLAIYDPTDASAQPVKSADGRYTLVFNGAIYNFRELRDELALKGHSFHTSGDAEVFLNAFVEWGPDCFARIEGMFAAVFYDAQRQVLTVARDRFGEKPLFLQGQDEKNLSLASELGQLRVGNAGPVTIDPVSLSEFLSGGRVDHRDDFPFVAAMRAPTGNWFSIDLSSDKVPDPLNIVDDGGEKFWTLPTPENMSESEAVRRLRAAMDEAVSRQLVADVPVGTCLSGGLDSSIILATADRLRESNSAPFVCVSAIFDEADDGGQSLSERPFVEAAIKGRNVELIEVHPGEDDVAEKLDAILETQGEPFPGTSICAQYFVFEAARKAGIKVMLDGQGADELFAGYAPMAAYGIADRLARLDPSAIREFEALTEAPSDLSTGGLARGVWRALISERVRRQLLAAVGRFPPRGGPVTLPVVAPPFTLLPDHSRLDTLVRELAVRASLPGLLRYEDRNAMAFAVETRLPFLSQAVGDLAFRIPSGLKVKDGYTKYILRKAFEDRLPPEIAWRRKKLGFVTPQQKWMRGRVGGWVDQHLENAIEAFRPILDDAWIARERARKTAGRTPDDVAFRVACAGRWAELTGAQL